MRLRFWPALAVVLTLACTGGWRPEVEESPLVREDAQLTVHHDVERREIVLELPPVPLPAHQGADHGHASHVTEAYIGRLPVSGWLRGYRTELVDDSGDTLPSRLLHHMNLMTPDRRELFSPIMQRIAAAGQETAPVELPRIFGYPIAAGERVLMKAMVHNPTGVDYDSVRVRVRLRYTPADVAIEPLHVFPFYLDVTPPAGLHSFDLPPGRSERSWEGSPAVPARIAALGGHLHRHALSLRLEDVTAGRVLWESRPRFDENGAVTAMPQDYVIRRLGIELDPAHTYRLTAVYDNPTGDTIVDGGMGALGGVVLVDRRAAWPGVDPEDSQYALDVQTTLDRSSDGGMSGEPVAPAGGHSAHAH